MNWIIELTAESNSDEELISRYLEMVSKDPRGKDWNGANSVLTPILLRLIYEIRGK